MRNVLVSIELLRDGCRSFARRCAEGMEPNRKRIAEHLESALMLVAALNPHIGYEKAAEVSLVAYREEMKLRDAALKLGCVTPDEFDVWVNTRQMTGT